MLKGDRQYVHWVSNRIAGGVIESGYGVVLSTSQPTGAATGQGINETAPVVVIGPASVISTTKFEGIAVNSAVSIDLAKQHLNYMRTDVPVGQPINILKHGWCWTNAVTGTPAAGDSAYLGANGTFQNTSVGSLPAIGKFETGKGPDGFLRISINVA